MIAAIAALMTSPASVRAVDGAPAANDYLQTTFTTDDELPSNVVNAVVQTANGLLWVGTNSGLVAFDGHAFLAALPDQRVFAAAEGLDGSLWLGTDSGVQRIDKGALNRWEQPKTTNFDLGHEPVECLLVARDGSTWAATSKGISRFKGQHFEMVVPYIAASRMEQAPNGHLLIAGPSGFMEWDGQRLLKPSEVIKTLGGPSGQVFHVFDDSHGTRWFATQNGLMKMQSGAPHWITHDPVYRLYEDHAGKLLAVSGRRFSPGGVYTVGEGGLQPVAVGQGGRALIEDRDGDVWIGTNGSGLIRLKPRAVRIFSAVDGLPNDHVNTAITDHEGKLWVGNNCGGISWFDGTRFHTLNEKNGLGNSCVTSLAEDTHHRLWIGTYDGMYEFEAGRFTHYSQKEGLPEPATGTIRAVPDGSLWIATRSGAVHFKDGKFRLYTQSDGLSSTHLFGIYASRNGGIWAGTLSGLDKLEGDRFVRAASGGDQIVLGEDAAGHLFLTTTAEGFRWLGGPALDGFGPGFGPMGMLDAGRDIWFSEYAITRVSTDGLKRSIGFSNEPLDCLRFSKMDGLTPPTGSGAQPAIARTRDGKIWFTQFQGLAMVDPARLVPAPKAAIAMRAITVDRVTRAPGNSLSLAPGLHHVELRFDNIEISSPERTRLQYQMEGVDSGWFDPGPIHTAVYPTVPVGAHKFLVRGSNRDGVWDRTGIVYDVVQQAFYYQTDAFRFALLALALLLGVGLYRLRVRQIEAQVQARLEGRMAERQRIARELHDTLLQGFQGLMMRFHVAAARLPEGEPTRQMLDIALDRADQILEEGRDRVKSLRKTVEDVRNLEESLLRAGEELAEGSATKLSMVVTGHPQELKAAVSDEVYWIAREALNNAFQHAAAERVDVEIEYGSRELNLYIRDDGRGINAQVLRTDGRAGHWGLRGMRERGEKLGGMFTVSSQSGHGTTVFIRIPASVAYDSKRD